jgi:transcriptional regulator with PAS, ATPase and Fis domain
MLEGPTSLRYLQWALAHHGGDRKLLADQLGISERTLYRKLAG